MASLFSPSPASETLLTASSPPPPNPFRQAQFVLSAARLAQLPADEVGEVAFVGRSNAGKSSALNKICDQRALARVSKTPGRTQLINLFAVSAEARLIDLPGYGFAQAPLAVKNAWGVLVGGYMEKRQNLRGVVVVMDIRHPLTELDWQMLQWGRTRGCPMQILLTKADKLGFGAAKQAVREVEVTLHDHGFEVGAQAFSSETGLGLETARATVAGWLATPPSVQDVPVP